MGSSIFRVRLRGQGEFGLRRTSPGASSASGLIGNSACERRRRSYLHLRTERVPPQCGDRASPVELVLPVAKITSPSGMEVVLEE